MYFVQFRVAEVMMKALETVEGRYFLTGSAAAILCKYYLQTTRRGFVLILTLIEYLFNFNSTSFIIHRG